MNKESLLQVRDLVISLVSATDINPLDQVELLINLDKFLSPELYDENIKVLQLSRTNKH